MRELHCGSTLSQLGDTNPYLYPLLRTNDEEKLDDISLIVGQFSMTIFHTGYLLRLSDTQSCFCCYDELNSRQHGKQTKTNAIQS